MERKKEKTKNTWRIFLSCLIFAFSFLMIPATTSWASGTNTVTVKAKVLGNCVFTVKNIMTSLNRGLKTGLMRIDRWKFQSSCYQMN